MLKLIGWMIMSAALTVLIASVTNAADEKRPGVVTQRFEINGDKAWIIPELGSLVTEEDGALVVKAFPRSGSLPKGHEAVDLKTGDQILMANGKKVNTAKELQALYDGLAVGEELKLGIKREGEMQIVGFKKADPATLPKRQMIIQKDGRTGDERIIKSPGFKQIRIDGDAANVTPVPDIGLVVGEKKSAVVVLALMPEAEQLFKGGVQEGDVVVSLAGKSLSTVQQFSETLETAKVGDALKIVVSRNGKEAAVTFTKPEASEHRIMIKH